VIEVKNVSKIYGKRDSAFAALKDVTFTIPDGATVAIVGKSGSGKSTLMHVMSGLDRPSEGEIVINGQSMRKLRRKAMDRFRAQDMSFIFQSFFVEANQTCYQNVALPLEINEVKRGERKAMVEAAMQQVDLAAKLTQKARNLSGGQKQRLAIARAIVNQPKLIFADEPTGNLDSATGELIIQLLFELNKTLGATLVMVTHDLDLAKRCQIQIALKDGEILAMKGGKGVVAKALKAPKNEKGDVVVSDEALAPSAASQLQPTPSMDVRPRRLSGFRQQLRPGRARTGQPADVTAPPKTTRKPAKTGKNPAPAGTKPATPAAPGSPQEAQRRRLLKRRRIIQ